MMMAGQYPPFSLVLPKKTGRARSKRKMLFALERDFWQKISVKALGAGVVCAMFRRSARDGLLPLFVGA